MMESTCAFVVIVAMCALALRLGGWLGRGPTRRTWLGLFFGLGLMVLWCWLQRHPAVAVQAIPVDVLRYIEGTAVAPVFLLVVGIAWSRSDLPRQKRLTVFAMVLGTLYLLNGGLWMLQPTPTSVLGREREVGLVRQTQAYSCVPAACATVLNVLGVPTSEAEMAELTQTRSGTGSTLIRAYAGLKKRLASTRYDVELLEPSYGQLLTLPTPIMTPIWAAATYRHMVVILNIDDAGVWIADPAQGQTYYSREEFEAIYGGEAIVFHGRKGMSNPTSD